MKKLRIFLAKNKSVCGATVAVRQIFELPTSISWYRLPEVSLVLRSKLRSRGQDNSRLG